MIYASTITQKGQVTIPVQIREQLQIQPKDKLIFRIKEKKMLVEPIKTDFMSLAGSLQHKNKGKRPINFKKVRQFVIKKIAENAAKEGI